MKKLHVELGCDGYDITIGGGLLADAAKMFDLNRKILVLTDDGVPENYAEKIKESASYAEILTLPAGEGTKSLIALEKVLTKMASMNMTRKDALVAVGGGVVGDLGGFAASCYMRGIDFYNVPTTLLAQVDSSIGGKTAINLNGIKNIVGAFHQPKGVLIDTDTLATLPKRHFSNGLCEAIKMALTCDAELFERLESYTPDLIEKNIEDIIESALLIKKRIVEEDERECGVRKILNFGHTIGHGIESHEGLLGLLHGECVALGMLPMCSPETKERLIKLLKKVALPTSYGRNIDDAIAYTIHDKKSQGKKIDTIFVTSPGKYEIRSICSDELSRVAKTLFN